MALDLDARCGRYLTFRDLIECGESWHQSAAAGSPIDNRPRQAESIDVLVLLCETILDPVIEAFGRISLTYGLATASLSLAAGRSSGGVAPKLDQHAAHELNQRGRRVCARDGAAADFRIEHASSLAVARWVVENTAFDRLYYYGPDRPLHVSAASEPLGQIVRLTPRGARKRMPQVVSEEVFLGQD